MLGNSGQHAEPPFSSNPRCFRQGFGNLVVFLGSLLGVLARRHKRRIQPDHRFLQRLELMHHFLAIRHRCLGGVTPRQPRTGSGFQSVLQPGQTTSRRLVGGIEVAKSFLHPCHRAIHDLTKVAPKVTGSRPLLCRQRLQCRVTAALIDAGRLLKLGLRPHLLGRRLLKFCGIRLNRAFGLAVGGTGLVKCLHLRLRLLAEFGDGLVSLLGADGVVLQRGWVGLRLHAYRVGEVRHGIVLPQPAPLARTDYTLTNDSSCEPP